jgi:hypothetical protein
MFFMFFNPFDMISFAPEARPDQRCPRTDSLYLVQSPEGGGRPVAGNPQIGRLIIKVLLINFVRISTGVIHFTPVLFPITIEPIVPCSSDFSRFGFEITAQAVNTVRTACG